ncbi:uncharacterized protein BO97DRAFT_445767 [Aspergillus homomorphus CBS 101889]|uniref:Uncharacterized protein n=1 Tax=Aspergillus homomorphus (strain CBS 101889) TaxID=1450537 RepID=A0A395HMT9_ASPHC|nr:hypothetical protein BO97DRAFT_445767 [Aspergillus homomorphus CBS 101889]RAL08936.1 hypothetical protein BO97DRAFT_445767 [Aspergillus homomorphus CBS 101889]
MRVFSAFTCLLRNFVVISLLASVLTSAYLDRLSHSLSSSPQRRSLPGSLATAPNGAVGYQPLPELVERPNPTTTLIAKPTALSQELSSNGGTRDTGSQEEVIVLAGTVTRAQTVLRATQTGVARRSITLEASVGLLAIVLCLYHL